MRLPEGTGKRSGFPFDRLPLGVRQTPLDGLQPIGFAQFGKRTTTGAQPG